MNKGAAVTYGLLMKSMEYHPGMDDEVFNYHSPKMIDSIFLYETLQQTTENLLKPGGKLFVTKKRYDRKEWYMNKNGQYVLKQKRLPVLDEQLQIEATQVGSSLRYVIRQYGDVNFYQFMQIINPSPVVGLFNKCLAETDLVAQQYSHGSTGKPNKKEMVDLYNSFVDKFRKAAKEPGFVSEVSAQRRRCNKNRQGIEKLIDSIFMLYSRVVVIRLDCTYHRPEGMPDDEFARHITVDQARKDLAAFLSRNATHGLCQHRIAYVAKMEMGPKKGIHFHIMMFFDGRHHREDITMATTLGKYWEYVTDKRGMFFNCNQKWHGKPHCAVGVIHRHDHDVRANLQERVVPYLTKMDEYFQFLPMISGRTLFRSKVKKPLKVLEAQQHQSLDQKAAA